MEQEIRKRLAEYYTSDEIDLWLTEPHPQLNNLTAMHVIERGHGDKVLKIIDRLDSAVYL